MAASSPARRHAPAHWGRRGALAMALLPLAEVFRAVAALRRRAYRSGILATPATGRPVIVVGNIAVGGSGKSPVVLWLAEGLRRIGHRPGIVSRGYGGTAGGPAEVPIDGDPERFGDEPVMIARTAGCPVYIGRDRPAAIAALLAAHPECSVVISDDGLQHYAMARRIEIAVVDEQVLGNRWLLPAGPLREPLARLREVDLVLLHGDASRSLRSAMGSVPAFAMRLCPRDLRRLDGRASEPLAAWRGRRVHAVAGIGRPERFFETLRAAGLEVIDHPFPDHHHYRVEDLALKPPAPLLMTSKDAVKCRSLAPPDSWELPVSAEIGEGAFETIVEKLADGQPPA